MLETNYRFAAAAMACVMTAAATAQAKTKHAPTDVEQDQIAIEGHIALSGRPITSLVTTQHYDRSYVYAERGPGNPVTLIDVTDVRHPAIVSEIPLTGEFLSVAGTAALTGQAAPAVEAAPQSVSIMDLSDPAHPKTTKTFDGVTAIEKMARGSIILLANKDGVWVLKQHLAPDPRIQEKYAREIVYGQM